MRLIRVVILFGLLGATVMFAGELINAIKNEIKEEVQE